MKKFYLTFIMALFFTGTFSGCKKNELGPTDIRIINKSVFTYEDVFVDTSEGTNEYGNVAPGVKTDYKRFTKAWREAYIQLNINGVKYEFNPVDYTYEIPLGKGKFSYELSADTTKKELSLHVTADAPL